MGDPEGPGVAWWLAVGRAGGGGLVYVGLLKLKAAAIYRGRRRLAHCQALDKLTAARLEIVPGRWANVGPKRARRVRV